MRHCGIFMVRGIAVVNPFRRQGLKQASIVEGLSLPRGLAIVLAGINWNGGCRSKGADHLWSLRVPAGAKRESKAEEGSFDADQREAMVVLPVGGDRSRARAQSFYDHWSDHRQGPLVTDLAITEPEVDAQVFRSMLSRGEPRWGLGYGC